MARTLKLKHIVLGMLLTTSMLPCITLADEFPSRPVLIVDAFPAGGATDSAARVMAQGMAPLLGQAVVVQNRPGVGGNLGADYVARSAPDGHTLLLGSSGPLTTSPSLYSKLNYDIGTDLVPVSGVASTGFVVTSSLYKTLDELIRQARTAGGRTFYGTGGIGTGAHLCIELLAKRAGVSFTHVPYKGGSQLMSALVAGEVALSCSTTTAVIGQINAGTLHALAVTTPQRLAALPDVPTLAESGFPGFDITSRLMLLAPAGTPREVLKRLRHDAGITLRTDGVISSLAAQGLTPDNSSPETLAAYLAEERTRMAQVIKGANIQMQ
ncbi:Bug family tripartite tricarboxylate transporter substrate binding protein [Paracandidimonas lactea]|uniref:Bug family tripartite tricarboxylate transporter substrate binding protein n=1 Tax=Paracandidimonas lactea TaxID=2895524 RepID=UPI001F1FE9C9|nr:tripartite tricarboxylate transporter substrate binding protein [Paracandidimonas lactea]